MKKSNKNALSSRKLVLRKEAIMSLSEHQLVYVAGQDGSGAVCKTNSQTNTHCTIT
jgi:hypothetical protein